MTIAVLSQKGGVGKTTLALHLAAARTKRWKEEDTKRRLTVLDLDDQESLFRYRKTLKRVEFLSVPLEKLPKMLAKAAEESDDVIIDAPRSLNDALCYALMSRVDAVIIPFIPEYDAVLAARKTLDAARKARKERPGFQFRLVIVSHGGARHRLDLARESRDYFSPWVCKSAIPISASVGVAARLGVPTFENVPLAPVTRAFARLELELTKEWEGI
jgi:cellulose biosynthesis protein BcsQ